MNSARKKVEEIKSDLIKQIESDALRYKRSIVRSVLTQWQSIKITTQDASLSDLQEKVLQRLRVPAASKIEIRKDILEAQEQIKSVWNDYFTDAINSKQIITVAPDDYEKMLAAYSVDFPAMEVKLAESMRSEFTKSIRANYSFENFRIALLQRDLGEASARTEANTAVAQFDNNYHVENARQAGIEEFEYDGTRSESIRDFCDKHLHKIYTIKQLAAMSNGQGLPVLYSLGGYNCTHYLTAHFKKEK